MLRLGKVARASLARSNPSLARSNASPFSSNKSFELISQSYSDDLGIAISRFYHQNSGAHIYRLANSDADNTFASIVKTLPEDDTGCPHILEHLACCGSHKYPIRDPFFNMLKRSVNTYMNAWTGDDFTAYPFSSANPKDHQNLYSVYLDMSLKPLLNELDFRQEGWRWEYSQSGEKELKGIVLNEMKGAYQNPERQMAIETNNRLFSGTPFGYDSGGKPESVVRLPYQQVRDMHSYYYHPSNMSFYYYGNADISPKLQFLEQHYLRHYQNQQHKYSEKSNNLMKGLQPPKQIYHEIEADNLESPSVSVTYSLGLLKDITPVETICLNILSYLLLETNQAILYQELIESGLADSFGYSGLQINTNLTFGVYLQNASLTQQDALQKIEDCLRRLADEGVNERRLDEFVHQTALQILTPKPNQGIQYLQTCMPYMNNRMPLVNMLDIKRNLQTAVGLLKDRTYLKQLMQKYFLSNKHKVSIRQRPSSTKKSEAVLTGLEMEEGFIRQQQEQLKQRQEQLKLSSGDCLPRMELGDLLEPKVQEYQVLAIGVSQKDHIIRSIHVKLQTPLLHVIRVAFKLKINKENRKLLQYLHLWAYTVNKGVGVAGLSSKELSAQLQMCSKDFNVSLQKASAQQDPNSINVVFTAGCLEEKVTEYLALLKRIIAEPLFEEDVLNIFRSYQAEMVDKLTVTPISQCLDHCSSFVNLNGEIFNTYSWITEGLKIAEETEIPTQFSAIHEILNSGCDATVIEHSANPTADILTHLGRNIVSSSRPYKRMVDWEDKKRKQRSVAVTHSFDVNFCTQQYPGPRQYSQDQAHLTLLLQILEQDYLHPRIREQGGAYGARAGVRQTGALSLFSYMDPNSSKTFETFDSSVQELLNKEISAAQLEEVKVKVLGEIDKPIVPQKSCLVNILKDVSNSQRHIFRNYILMADPAKVLESGRKYLKPSLKQRVIFGKDIPEGFEDCPLEIPTSLEEEQEAEY